ncbi:alpha/beta hydrolase [Nitriliruptoraceae bacterium ZYF776]|nr:alpha/beta hydrolase [Profundirhabdus halotolerans]
MTSVRLPDDLPGPVTRAAVAGRARGDGSEVTLAVAAVGDPRAPALVVAHGAGSSARFVAAAFAAPVLAAGWRLVTYDLRGHGASTPCPDPADHDLVVQVADLDEVVAHAGDVVAVGGVSLGGHAALSSAARSGRTTPVLACLPAWLGTARRGVGPHAAVAAEVRQVGIAAVVRRLREDTTLPPWLRATLVADYERHDQASLTAALVALDGGRGPTRDEVTACGAPVALVAWRDDPGHPFAVAAALAQAAARSALEELHLAELDADLTRFGAAAVRALRAVTG